MKKEFLECGRVLSSFGVTGELRVAPWCDDPHELIGVERLYLDGEGREVLSVEGIRVHKGQLLIKFKGLDSPEEAIARLRQRVLFAHRSVFSLAAGQHFIQDLIGLSAVDADDGHEYGRVCDVTSTGANDVYHIEFPDGQVRLIPAIPQVVVSVDVDGGAVRIRPLKGLFDDED